MRDGVRLATDVYLPPNPGALPAVLVRLPYDKNGWFGFWSLAASFFNARGYAVVIQDTRGKNRSEGHPLAFHHEASDGFDTLEWIERQPWSNRIVGMFGESYVGFTQWAAKGSGHPALRAIVPRLTTTEVARDWMYHQGVFCLETMAEWASQAWLDSSLYEGELDWTTRPLADIVPAIAGGTRSESFDRWIRELPDAAYWRQAAVFPTPLSGRSLPALHWGGWWDIFRKGQIRDYQSAASHSDAQYLIMSSLDHMGNTLAPDDAPQDAYAMTAEGIERALPGLLEPIAEFFDRHLRDRHVAVPRIRWHLANDEWRTADEWPPPGSRELRLFLTDLARAAHGPGGGALALKPDSARGSASWVHDPGNLVPSVVDAWSPLLWLPDEREVELRDDVLTFTSDVFDPLDLAGPVMAHLEVAGTDAPAHLVAKLVDVFPTGRARRITEGAIRLPASSEELRGDIDLGHVGYRVRAGHALRLEVSASSFPRYLPASGSDADPWWATAAPVSARRLESGGEGASYVSLRVVGNRSRG